MESLNNVIGTNGYWKVEKMTDKDELIYIGNDGREIHTTEEISLIEERTIPDNYKDSLLANLYSTVEILKNELEEKNFIIKTLLKQNGENNNVIRSCRKSEEADVIETSYFNSELKNGITNINNEYIAVSGKRKYPANRSLNASSSKDINKTSLHNTPIYNRFNGLETEDINDSDNEFIDECNEITTPPIHYRDDTSNKRPTNVMNNYPDNDKMPFHNKHKKLIPGASSYANITKHGKKVCIISNSIAQKINIKQFNRIVNNAKVYKKIFPGATAEDILHYAVKILEDKTLDTVILNIGINDLSNRNGSKQLDIQITSAVLKIVDMCRQAGVNYVYVAGITYRLGYQKIINEVNELFKLNAAVMGYKYIDNTNIVSKHLSYDGIHLNRDGIDILANNFIDALNDNKCTY